MKLSLMLILFYLAGCSQLMNGQIQPVVQKKQNVYYTTCSGAVENMASCNRKAMDTCSNGYNILDKFQDANALRALTFECKK